jgi:acyl transferase domain-containing protein
MFPGLGNHYVNMGLELYRSERVFREEIDHCCEFLRPLLGVDLREIIYPSGKEPARAAAATDGRLDLRRMLKPFDQEDEAAQRLNQTALTQPALFVIEYALAKLWMSWGVQPQVMIGYSIGEYVAACLAEVFSLEDGLSLVGQRAQMIQDLPRGSMLAVPLSEDELQPFLSESISLAAINGPSLSVVAGPVTEIADLERLLSKRGLVCRQLAVSHAFHSKMMTAIVEPFTKLVQSIELKAPQIPFVSNVTGKRITPAQATDASYWANHMCQAVQFSDGISELLKTPRRILLELGPGQVLGAWALQHPANQANTELQVVASMRHSYDSQSDVSFLLNALGSLWSSGVSVDWSGFYADETRHRVPLPTYPFEPQRYWINPKQRSRESSLPVQQSLDKKKDISEWFYVPVWKQSEPDVAAENNEAALSWLVFTDELGIGARLAERLQARGHQVLTVRQGEQFARSGEREFIINPAVADDYRSLLTELRDQTFERIVHLWSVLDADDTKTPIEFAEQCQEVGFNSLLLLAQAIGNHSLSDSLHVDIVSNNMHEVFGEDDLHAAKATLLGPCKVIPQEFANVTCRSIDLIVPSSDDARERLIDQLGSELTQPPVNAIFALRGPHRWQQTFEPVRLDKPATPERAGGVYLITGGVGGIGFSLAKQLAAQTPHAKLVLTGRTQLPEREQWTEWLDTHDGSDEVSRKIRKAQELEQMGAEVWMLSADVTDGAAMQAVIKQTRERFGELTGVVHAAGISPGGLIQVKSIEMAAGVLSPKIKGTMILEELLRDTKLDFFILCSSLVAITGGVGMVDHCGANAFLDAFARRQAARGNSRILSLNWDAWLEEGQAARASVSSGLKDLLQTSHSIEIDHPLLDRGLVEEDNRRIYLTRLSTTKHWVLDQHRIMGHAVFPGTAFLEMVRAAFERQAPRQPIAMERVLFMSPLIVQDGEEKEIRTIIEQSGEPEHFSFLVVSKGKQDEWQEHVRGEIASISSEPARQHQLQTIAARCGGEIIVGEEDLGGENGNGHKLGLSLGPRWQNVLKQVNTGDNEGLAYLELTEEFAADLQQFGMHPSLLDVATGIAQVAGRGSYLPLAYESVHIHAPLPAKIYSHVKYRNGSSVNKETIACDISIMDEDGKELLAIRDFTLKKINTDEVQSQSVNGSRPQMERLAVEQELPQSANDGIFPGEGAEAFSRVLNFKRPQLAISIKDLPLVIERASLLTGERILEEIEKLQSHRAKHPRPNVQTPYVEPRNELERTLVNLWEDILGLEQVGIYDNFFSIGGDSLLATQLISRVSKTFKVDLPLRAVFESPTAIELSVSITQRQAEHLDNDELEQIMAELEALPD